MGLVFEFGISSSSESSSNCAASMARTLLLGVSCVGAADLDDAGEDIGEVGLMSAIAE